MYSIMYQDEKVFVSKALPPYQNVKGFIGTVVSVNNDHGVLTVEADWSGDFYDVDAEDATVIKTARK